MKDRTLQHKWKNIGWAVIAYVLLLCLGIILSSMMKGGRVSPGWVFFIIDCLCLGGIGILFLALLVTGAITSRATVLACFLVVSNLVNAILGFFILDGSSSVMWNANNYLLLGATGLIGLLIGVKIGVN